MLGSWEFVIISVVVAAVVWPYFRKKSRQTQQTEQARRRPTYQPPKATTVSYEPAEDEE